MMWLLSHRFDRPARLLADRHYSRQKPGTPQFVQPGRCLVLRTPESDAYWVTSWQFAEFTKHEWPGAWLCSAFRNESPHLSSELIREAVAATRWRWPEVPALGMVTFVDPSEIRSTNPGFCYQMAGFHRVGATKAGLLTLQLLPREMPEPVEPMRRQPGLFDRLEEVA